MKKIEDNSGDIVRLEHISDFLKKNKPPYNTDKKYLEKKKIIKKRKWTNWKISRIRKRGSWKTRTYSDNVKKARKLYESDKQYLENNFKIKIIEK